MANKWIEFVRKYNRENPHLSWKQALEQAKPLYHKMKGGMAVIPGSRTMTWNPDWGVSKIAMPMNKSVGGKVKRMRKLKNKHSMKGGNVDWGQVLGGVADVAMKVLPMIL